MLHVTSPAARIGYIRASATGLDRRSQESDLRAAGCEAIRAELPAALDLIGEGDDLVVTGLDRLGLSPRDVLALVRDLDGRGAALAVLEPAFSTWGAAGPVLAAVLAMVGEPECRPLRARQQAGIEAAKTRGVYRGRRPSIDPAKVRELQVTGLGATEIAAQLGIARASVYRVMGQPAHG